MAGAGSEGRRRHELGRRLEERAAVTAAGCEGVSAARGWVLRRGGCCEGVGAAGGWVLHLLGCRGAEHELPLRLQPRGLQLRRGLERIDAVQQRELRSIGAGVMTQREG